MADAEIDVIRGLLAAHPRPATLSERRQRLDALGTQYPLPPDGRSCRSSSVTRASSAPDYLMTRYGLMNSLSS